VTALGVGAWAVVVGADTAGTLPVPSQDHLTW